MIDVKDAVKAAREYLNMVYEGKAANVRLEEVQTAESPNSWLITLSFSLPGVDEPTAHPLQNQFANVLGPWAWPRQMKVFTVDELGRARSMKIRE